MNPYLGTLGVFALLLAIYGAVLWFTRSGGPCEVMAWWDEGQGR
jgi:hypothetical protein